MRPTRTGAGSTRPRRHVPASEGCARQAAIVADPTAAASALACPARQNSAPYPLSCSRQHHRPRTACLHMAAVTERSFRAQPQSKRSASVTPLHRASSPSRDRPKSQMRRTCGGRPCRPGGMVRANAFHPAATEAFAEQVPPRDGITRSMCRSSCGRAKEVGRRPRCVEGAGMGDPRRVRP